MEPRLYMYLIYCQNRINQLKSILPKAQRDWGWFIPFTLLSVYLLTHCHIVPWKEPFHIKTPFANDWTMTVNCFLGGTRGTEAGLPLISSLGDGFDVLKHCHFCLFVRSHRHPRIRCSPCLLLEGLSRANRWANDQVDRQETDIIMSPLWGSHYQGSPSGTSRCFPYYLTSTLACAAQESGCTSRQLRQMYQFQH